MTNSLGSRLNEIGYRELKPLADADMMALVSHLLDVREVRQAAAACAFQGATLDELAVVADPIVRGLRPEIDGNQFFDLVTEIATQVRRGV
ncbi:MAG: hypothetical protein IPK81_24855 [Rhodospirillales bacterium]|nr:MAG: hypothetical protein IPK81_24855 [Rhodospirillales bacterium]